MTLNYDQLKHFISSSRIKTYEKFFRDHSDEEIYGVYIWNKILCGSIYPLLQSVEITIRNTINNVAVTKYGAYWYENIDHVLYNNIKHDVNYTKLKNNFESARRKWLFKENNRRKNKGLSLHPSDHKPDFNCIIAESDFSTWEYVLHRCFSKLNSPGEKFLWPHLLSSAFENWPYQGAKKTRETIHELVSELRAFRNRLSHHEPLWKGVGINNEKDALIFINKKIDAIEKLLNIISTEQVEFIRRNGLFIKARSLATKESLDFYRCRTKCINLTLKKKAKMRKFILSLSERDGRRVAMISGRKILIELM